MRYLLFFLCFSYLLTGKALCEERLFQGIVVYEQEALSSFENLGISCFLDKEKSEIEALEKALSPYLQKPITKENLIKIKQEISAIFKEHPELIVVEIPEQKIEKGVVSFHLLSAKIADVSYKGRYWMPLWHYTRYLSAKKGEPVCKDTLLNEAAWINLNPFRHVDVVFSPGEKKGTTDVEFLIQDRFPVSLSVGMDNTGNSYTGNHRIYTGLQWGNAFGVGDLFSYQFTVSDEYTRFYSHFGSYHSYLPWKHVFQLYGAYSRSKPEAESFRSDGKSVQASLRYQIPFPPFYTSLSQQFSCGFDYKAMNSSLFFTSQENQLSPQVKAADLIQVVLEYELQKSFAKQRLFAKAEVFASPFKVTEAQKRALYSLIRQGASPFFFYAKGQLNYIYEIYPFLSLYVELKGQGASRTLLPSEAFGIGGYGSVRGYSERVFIADNAFLSNIELRSSFSFGPYSFRNEVTSYLFVDFGFGHNYKGVADLTEKHDYLWSIGPGVRWKIAPYFQARVDYGFQLHSFEKAELGKLHFSLAAQW